MSILAQPHQGLVSVLYEAWPWSNRSGHAESLTRSALSPSAGGTAELNCDKAAAGLGPALSASILKETVPGATSVCPQFLSRRDLSSVAQGSSLMLGPDSPPGNNTLHSAEKESNKKSCEE